MKNSPRHVYTKRAHITGDRRRSLSRRRQRDRQASLSVTEFGHLEMPFKAREKGGTCEVYKNSLRVQRQRTSGGEKAAQVKLQGRKVHIRAAFATVLLPRQPVVFGCYQQGAHLAKKLLVFIRHLSLGRYCGYSCSALRGLIFLLGAANRAHTERGPAHQVVEIAKVTSSAWVLPAGRTPGENSWGVVVSFAGSLLWVQLQCT